MTNSCPFVTHCWISALYGLGWLLLSSGLLLLTWNKVIVAMTKAKKAKYGQALLVVATFCIFYCPFHMRHRECWHGKGDCPYGERHAPCPYSHGESGEQGKAQDKK